MTGQGERLLALKGRGEVESYLIRDPRAHRVCHLKREQRLQF